MIKYSIGILLGILGGIIGVEMGLKSLDIFPIGSLFSSPFVPILVLFISSVPFFTIMLILIFKLQGYKTFAKGFCFSLAYYLPFQYKSIGVNLKHPNAILTEIEPVLITLAGALFLSGIYYLCIIWHNRTKKSET